MISDTHSGEARGPRTRPQARAERQRRSALPAAAMALFMLFESASGYALFEVTETDELGQTSDTVQVSHQLLWHSCLPSPTPLPSSISLTPVPPPNLLPAGARGKPVLPLSCACPCQATAKDLARFSKAVKFIAFKPFTNAADALEQVSCSTPFPLR